MNNKVALTIALLGGLCATAAISLPSSPAQAACYEDIGCTDSATFSRAGLEGLSCQILWEVRNQIYHENGYCFRSARGKAAFGNDSCSVDDAGSVKLNTYERSNVSLIRKVERASGC